MKILSIKTFLGITLILFSVNFFAQDSEPIKYTASNKGKFFVSWGGNRESFSKSDIHFKGDDYDFTIKDATAKDKPKGWHIKTVARKCLKKKTKITCYYLC